MFEFEIHAADDAQRSGMGCRHLMGHSLLDAVFGPGALFHVEGEFVRSGFAGQAKTFIVSERGYFR